MGERMVGDRWTVSMVMGMDELITGSPTTLRSMTHVDWCAGTKCMPLKITVAVTDIGIVTVYAEVMYSL
jgi:hypothetical protein